MKSYQVVNQASENRFIIGELPPPIQVQKEVIFIKEIFAFLSSVMAGIVANGSIILSAKVFARKEFTLQVN